MYGTVMIGKLRGGVEEMVQASRDWSAQRQVPGFVRSDVLVADEGGTVVMAVQFDSSDHYWALAKDPAQDEWWRTVMEPMLDGEPTWVDGTWIAGSD